MSVEGLMNQQISLYTAGNVDRTGKRTFGSATTVKARFRPVNKTFVRVEGNIEPIDAIVVVPRDTTVAVGDKITYSSVNYRVMQRMPGIDGRGKTNHIELKAQEWNT